MSKKGPRYLAIQNGEKQYMSENPCKRGHLSLRITATGSCIECIKINEKVRYYANPEKTKATTKRKYDLNAEKLREKRRALYAISPEKEKESSKIRSKLWRENNPALRNALAKNYKEAKSRRMPKWLAQDHLIAIKCKYSVASMLNIYGVERWHVDHIVPLRGKDVCGLHVPWNLQVIPAKVNISKGRKFASV